MPLITLTSDIGSPDYLVAAIKAQLLQINPAFRIVDISHNIPPFNHPQAAYVCRSAIGHFPAFTYHLILVNIFDQKPKQLLLAFHNNQYLLCADNGLMTMILEDKPEMVIGISLDQNERMTTTYIARRMGEVVQQLVNGEPIRDLGTPEPEYLEKRHLRPVLEQDSIEGQIVFIDSFENVIVNITRQQFEEQRKGRGFRINFKRDEYITRISDTYADVPQGDKLALFNSAGYLEIAVNKGNAAGLFGLKGFSEMQQSQLSYQTVKIYFE